MGGPNSIASIFLDEGGFADWFVYFLTKLRQTIDATSLRELTATVYLINLENEPGASQRLLAAVAAAIQPEIKKKLNSIL